MITIPSTFNEYQIKRTVIGGNCKFSSSKMNISVIILNKSGSHIHVQSIENLLKCGFRSIVSVEPDIRNYNIEDLSRRYPSVKFFVPLEETNDGVIINMAMNEINSEYVLILRDYINITSGILLKNLAENLIKDKTYCIVPRLFESGGESICVNIIPEAERGKFKMIQESIVGDKLQTLYPFNYIGLYNRLKFIQLGGFDYTICSPYWQNADLALRSWLWGEKTVISTSFILTLLEPAPIEDTTTNIHYLRFYLKNILPKYKDYQSSISKFSFIRFLNYSSCGFFEALSQFNEACSWVKKNKFRFKYDVQDLIENWEMMQNEKKQC